MQQENLNEALSVIKLCRGSIAQAQSLLCDAYEDNKFTRYIFNAEKKGYQQRLRGFIHEKLLLHFSLSNISFGLILEQRLVGVAMVSCADFPLNLTTNWRWRMGMYSVTGITCTERLRRYYRLIHKALENKQHYWISLMGLHRDVQHHGFGHALVEAVHQECEKQTAYCGISTDSIDSQYQCFFKSLGYKKEAHFDIGGMTMDVLFHR